MSTSLSEQKQNLLILLISSIMSETEFSEDDESVQLTPQRDDTQETYYAVYSILEEQDEEEEETTYTFESKYSNIILDSVKPHVDARVTNLIKNVPTLVRNRSFTETISIPQSNKLFLCVFCYITNEETESKLLVCLLVRHSKEVDNSMQLFVYSFS